LNSRYFLICIDGIGGIGKTSLALEVIHECLRFSKGEIKSTESQPIETNIPKFEGFVWTSAKDRELHLNDILDAIARTLDWPGIAQPPYEEKRESVRKLLQTNHYLLIVDNFETITDETIRDFLLKIPEPSKVLITSREQKLPQAWAVSIKGLEQNEALVLIRNEGQRLGLKSVAEADDQVLLRLYQATGGAPLAIKWSVGQIKQKGQSLDTVLAALHAAKGDIFKEVFVRSWSLLSEDARKILRVMPIFASSTSRDAIEAASDVHHFDLDEALGQLVQMWLVEVTDELETAKRRYSVHPLTRAFANRRLNENSEFSKKVKLQTVQFYLDFTKQFDNINWEGFRRLELERENIIFLMEWCLESKKWRQFIDLEARIGYFLSFQGYWDEQIELGIKVFEGGIQIDDKVSAGWAALNSVGWTYRKRANYEKAKEWTQTALKLFDEEKDTRGKAAAIRGLGAIAERQKKFDEAKHFYQQCLMTSNNPIDREAVYDIYVDLGDVARKQNDLDEAEKLYTKQLNWWREINDPIWIAIISAKLGSVAFLRNNFMEALDRFNFALEGNQILGNKIGIAFNKWGLADVCKELGDLKRFRSFAIEALEIYERLGMKDQTEEIKEIFQIWEESIN